MEWGVGRPSGSSDSSAGESMVSGGRIVDLYHIIQDDVIRLSGVHGWGLQANDLSNSTQNVK